MSTRITIYGTVLRRGLVRDWQSNATAALITALAITVFSTLLLIGQSAKPELGELTRRDSFGFDASVTVPPTADQEAIPQQIRGGLTTTSESLIWREHSSKRVSSGGSARRPINSNSEATETIRGAFAPEHLSSRYIIEQGKLPTQANEAAITRETSLATGWGVDTTVSPTPGPGSADKSHTPWGPAEVRIVGIVLDRNNYSDRRLIWNTPVRNALGTSSGASRSYFVNQRSLPPLALQWLSEQQRSPDSLVMVRSSTRDDQDGVTGSDLGLGRLTHLGWLLAITCGVSTVLTCRPGRHSLSATLQTLYRIGWPRHELVSCACGHTATVIGLAGCLGMGMIWFIGQWLSPRMSELQSRDLSSISLADVVPAVVLFAVIAVTSTAVSAVRSLTGPVPRRRVLLRRALGCATVASVGGGLAVFFKVSEVLIGLTAVILATVLMVLLWALLSRSRFLRLPQLLATRQAVRNRSWMLATLISMSAALYVPMFWFSIVTFHDVPETEDLSRTPHAHVVVYDGSGELSPTSAKHAAGLVVAKLGSWSSLRTTSGGEPLYPRGIDKCRGTWQGPATNWCMIASRGIATINEADIKHLIGRELSDSESSAFRSGSVLSLTPQLHEQGDRLKLTTLRGRSPASIPPLPLIQITPERNWSASATTPGYLINSSYVEDTPLTFAAATNPTGYIFRFPSHPDHQTMLDLRRAITSSVENHGSNDFLHSTRMTLEDVMASIIEHSAYLLATLLAGLGAYYSWTLWKASAYDARRARGIGVSGFEISSWQLTSVGMAMLCITAAALMGTLASVVYNSRHHSESIDICAGMSTLTPLWSGFLGALLLATCGLCAWLRTLDEDLN